MPDPECLLGDRPGGPAGRTTSVAMHARGAGDRRDRVVAGAIASSELPRAEAVVVEA
jgi:hypothetical protein